MSSAPIAIKSASPASSVASSPPSGLYVPVHKRSSSITSTDDSMSTMSSSRPSSRAESHAELGAEHSETGHWHALVYSRDRLMALAKSPLATMSKDAKDDLKARLPEIVMSRKFRKAMEYRALMEQRGQNTQAQAQGQQTRTPVQAQQVNNAAHKGSKNIESVQQQQSYTGAAHHHHHHGGHQPAKAPQQPQKQPHIQAQGQTTVVQHPVPRKSHPRPVAWGRPAVDDRNWRRSISVV